MNLVTWHRGFRQVEGDPIIRPGSDLVSSLADAVSAASAPVALRAISRALPILGPRRIVCFRLNYRSYSPDLASGQYIPTGLTVVAKFSNSLVAPDDEISVPPESQAVGCEAKMAGVMGRSASRVSAEPVLDRVAAHAWVNHRSARDPRFHERNR
jgi:acylpyruvate hydrolase